MKRKKRAKVDQLTFDRFQRGGTRPGAGRRKSKDAGVSHAKREELDRHHPVHVTLRLAKGLGGLRAPKPMHVLRMVFDAACKRDDFRIVHWSIRTNPLHLLVEADDEVRLARRMQGSKARMARELNKMWQRGGAVFAGRYHARTLRSPRQVKHALCYVLNKARKHGLRLPADMPDPCSSGDCFDGWRQSMAEEPEVTSLGLVARARSWLLTRGWLHYGPIDLAARPASG